MGKLENNPTSFFEKNNYIFMKNIIDKSYCEHLVSCVNKSILKNEYRFFDPISPTKYILTTVPYFEKLLLEFQNNMENLVNKKLYPTYSCCRMYLKNERLIIHTDQDSCEYSATITLGYSPELKEPWEFCISKNDKFKNVEQDYTSFQMDVGDAIIYSGFIPHWRKGPLNREWHCQVFLHYVDANGPYAGCIYNCRDSLNL